MLEYLNGLHCPMNAAQQKPLKINIGAVKRLAKEKGLYQKELKEAEDKVAGSTFDPGSPEHRRLTNLREESEATLRDVEVRYEDFKKKLQTALNEVAAQFPDDPLVIEAQGLLAA
jgi:hypothetical protein